jgi:hypothetical protein
VKPDQDSPVEAWLWIAAGMMFAAVLAVLVT